MTFEQAEKAFYEQNFGYYLDDKNRRVIEQRHPERVRTMDDYRTSARTCPEETIYQIGKTGQTVDPGTLWTICCTHINWLQKRYKNVKLLDAALHVDEQGAPHLHVRQVWVAHDGNTKKVSQTEALAEMGVQPPDPDRPIDRHNNAKVTYTRECRDHLIEVCQKYGIDIETEPQAASRSGLTLLEYQTRAESEKTAILARRQEQIKQDIESALETPELGYITLINDIRADFPEVDRCFDDDGYYHAPDRYLQDDRYI